MARTAALACLAVLLVAVPAAQAELTHRGNLFVRFDGGISPSALPRNDAAPIGVRIEGRIRTLKGRRPALRRIRVALHRAGRLQTRGLPVCPRRRIEDADNTQALAACAPALVGVGGITGRSSFENQARALVRGDLLLFNSTSGGRPVILAHYFQTTPARTTTVFVFRIRRTGGTFGTVITAKLPESLNRNGYMTSIFMRLQRTYVFRGRRRAYLSAGCGAPPGFRIAVFPFALASMGFDDGRTLSSKLIRSCRVRG